MRYVMEIFRALWFRLKHVRSRVLWSLINYAALYSDNAHCVGTASRRELMTTLLRHNERLGTDCEISNLMWSTLFYSTVAALIVAITMPNSLENSSEGKLFVVSLAFNFSFCCLFRFVLSLSFIISSIRWEFRRNFFIYFLTRLHTNTMLF